MSTTNKYIGTLVHAATKTKVVAIREKSKLSEKDIMELIVDFGLQHEVEILEIAAEKVKGKADDKEAKKKDRYEKFKAAMKVARAAMKATAADTTSEASTDETPESDETTAEEPTNEADMGDQDDFGTSDETDEKLD